MSLIGTENKPEVFRDQDQSVLGTDDPLSDVVTDVVNGPVLTLANLIKQDESDSPPLISNEDRATFPNRAPPLGGDPAWRKIADDYAASQAGDSVAAALRPSVDISSAGSGFQLTSGMKKILLWGGAGILAVYLIQGKIK